MPFLTNGSPPVKLTLFPPNFFISSNVSNIIFVEASSFALLLSISAPQCEHSKLQTKVRANVTPRGIFFPVYCLL